LLNVSGLCVELQGDDPQGWCPCASSALIVSIACAISDFSKEKHSRRALAELCGEAEWYVGTRGGSGDHAAMLLGHRAGLTHLCFRPPFEVRGVLHSPFPASCQLILANSRRQARKSGAQRHFFNRGVFAYRFAFLALQRALREIGPALGVARQEIEETTCLGDVRTERFKLETIYRLLMSLPERSTPAALREQFPAAFEAAARGCFGSADLAALPDEVPLRGAAMYGLARVDRGLLMP